MKIYIIALQLLCRYADAAMTQKVSYVPHGLPWPFDYLFQMLDFAILRDDRQDRYEQRYIRSDGNFSLRWVNEHSIPHDRVYLWPIDDIPQHAIYMWNWGAYRPIYPFDEPNSNFSDVPDTSFNFKVHGKEYNFFDLSTECELYRHPSFVVTFNSDKRNYTDDDNGNRMCARRTWDTLPDKVLSPTLPAVVTAIPECSTRDQNISEKYQDYVPGTHSSCMASASTRRRLSDEHSSMSYERRRRISAGDRPKRKVYDVFPKKLTTVNMVTASKDIPVNTPSGREALIQKKVFHSKSLKKAAIKGKKVKTLAAINNSKVFEANQKMKNRRILNNKSRDI